MRRLILLLLCTATLGLASCKKDTIVQEPLNKTIIYDIGPNQWISSDAGKLLTNTFTDIDELDKYGVLNEGVLVSISYNNEASYIQLPFVYNQDSYGYEISEGKIIMTIQRSDNINGIPTKPNGPVKVKVVILASKNVT